MARRDDPDRLARVRQLERQERTRKIGRYAAYAVVGFLVIAGAAYGISKLPKQPGQVHWHAKYRVVVNDQLVNFVNPRFDGMKYGDAHLHAPDYDLIHNEGRQGRGTMGSFFEFTLGGKLADNEMILPQGTSAPGDYKANANDSLEMIVSNQAKGQEWTLVQGGFAGTEFHDGDRVLILYGNYTTERVQQYETAFPDFDPNAQSKTMPTSPTKPS